MVNAIFAPSCATVAQLSGPFSDNGLSKAELLIAYYNTSH